ncbi:MAG: DUF1826 domain-containing protein [Idiomarina sp.]|nr:DUF1826 domain-containing protein [Idiomarina sp.]
MNLVPLAQGRSQCLTICGERWNEGHGLVHRSPAADENDRRLLLTLDFA